MDDIYRGTYDDDAWMGGSWSLHRGWDEHGWRDEVENMAHGVRVGAADIATGATYLTMGAVTWVAYGIAVGATCVWEFLRVIHR